MAALTQSSLALRTQPFHKTVRWISDEPVRSLRRPKSEQALLDEFFEARPWFPEKPICRLDAPALCLYLRRHGIPANLVFGVKLEPFAAHCWVQSDNRILNEPLELVARYSPILVV